MHIPTIPSHLNSSYYDGRAFGNFKLQIGEVIAIHYPKDPKNVSKKFIEYQVWVQQRSNGTANSVQYENCLHINTLAGLADKFNFTLRADNVVNKKTLFGRGSKVLLLCLNGEPSNAVIIGGLRDYADDDDGVHGKDHVGLGHHMHFVFNGVDVFINDDGELTLSINGPTNNDGTAKVKDAGGSLLRMSKDGGFMVITPSGSVISISETKDKQGIKFLSGGSWVTLDKGGLTCGDPSGASFSLGSDATGTSNFAVASDASTIASSRVNVGAGADTPAVRGQDLVTWLTNLITVLSSATTTNAVPGSPCSLNPSTISQLTALTAQLQQILSFNVMVK